MDVLQLQQLQQLAGAATNAVNSDEWTRGIQSYLRPIAVQSLPVLWGAMLLVSPVFAQSGEETGVELCQSAPYNFFVGIGWMVIGFSTLAIGMAIFSGGAAKAFGFVSNRVSKAGNTALVGGLAAFGLIALVLVAAGIAFGTMPVSPPTECVVFF